MLFSSLLLTTGDTGRPCFPRDLENVLNLRKPMGTSIPEQSSLHAGSIARKLGKRTKIRIGGWRSGNVFIWFQEYKINFRKKIARKLVPLKDSMNALRPLE